MRVRKEKLRRQSIGVNQVHVDVSVELVFVVAPGQDSRVVDTGALNLRTRDQKGSVRVPRVQQVESHWINVCAVRRDCHASKESRLATEDCSQRRGGAQ